MKLKSLINRALPHRPHPSRAARLGTPGRASAPLGRLVFVTDPLAQNTRGTKLMSDRVVSIQQKEICRSSRQLSDEGALNQLIQFVPAGESETYHSVGRILFNRAQGCAGQLFSQRQSELS